MPQQIKLAGGEVLTMHASVTITGAGAWQIELPQGQRLWFKRRPDDECLWRISETAREQIAMGMNGGGGS